MPRFLSRDRLAVLAGLMAAACSRAGFLMTPVPGARTTLEQRLLAVALADQVGAALATSYPADQS